MKEIRVLMFKEGDGWVGLTIEGWIASQAKCLDDLHIEMLRIVWGHVVTCREHAADPWRLTLPDDAIVQSIKQPESIVRTMLVDDSGETRWWIP